MERTVIPDGEPLRLTIDFLTVHVVPRLVETAAAA